MATVSCSLPTGPKGISHTAHTHNPFRPGCLGRHLRWDVPATRCRPNQTAVQRKLKKKKKRKPENMDSKSEPKKWRPDVRERGWSESIRLRSPGSFSSTHRRMSSGAQKPSINDSPRGEIGFVRAPFKWPTWPFRRLLEASSGSWSAQGAFSDDRKREVDL